MDIFDLSASLTLDSAEYETGLTNAESKAYSFGTKLGKVLKTSAKAFAIVGAAATAAGVKIGKMALDAYADYEQLEGGVKKLYGKSADQVMQYAKDAYKTAGMSANQYMEQATSFSAALVNSLGGDTKKAAEQTDVAMRAISDNFNTFGGDMSMIQGAFQGFAKQNYTMLDNLKLGYGGTKQEMERLIDDANEYAKANGMAADLSIESFSDIVTAIDLVQQKQNIAGTTAKEASTTISGSIGQVKGAWENLLSGFANPEADIGALVENLVSSLGTAAENIVPAIGQIAEGFGAAAKDLIPKMLSMIVQGLPDMVKVAGQIIEALVQGLITAIPQIAKALPKILSTVAKMIGELAQNIAKSIPVIANAIIDNLDAIVEAGVQILIALAEGFVEALPKLIDALPKIIGALLDAISNNLPKLASAGVKIIVALVKGIVKAIPKLIVVAAKCVKALVKAVISGVGMLISAGAKLALGIITGIGKMIGNAVAKVKQLVSKVKDAVVSAAKGFASAGMNIVKGIWQGISNGFGWIKSKIKGWVGNVKSFFKKLFGIKSPSTWARKEIGLNIAKGFALGVEDGQDEVSNAIDDLVPNLDASINVSRANPTNADNLIKNSGQSTGDIIINLNYQAGDDANEMLQDIARGIKRYRMAGAF